VVSNKTPWSSISDLMTALMVVFLFISIGYSYQITQQSQKILEQSNQIEQRNNEISNIVSEWRDYKKLIYKSLLEEFEDDLRNWDAEITEENLSIRFNNPSVLFRAGSSEISQEFNDILRDFWPRYISTVKNFERYVREVRIEGHTSSEWENVNLNEAYFNNMALSQSRTRSALQNCYYYTAEEDLLWVRKNVTANGMSSSRLIYNDNGSENVELSRRVEFTIVVDSSRKLQEISQEVAE
jgi:outer membrane protein OmpA-like peptidoglycan-associated protein